MFPITVPYIFCFRYLTSGKRKILGELLDRVEQEDESEEKHLNTVTIIHSL